MIHARPLQRFKMIPKNAFSLFRKQINFWLSGIMISICNCPVHVGMSGLVVLDDKGDREPDYWVTDMNPGDGSFRISAKVENTDNGGRVSDVMTTVSTADIGHNH